MTSTLAILFGGAAVGVFLATAAFAGLSWALERRTVRATLAGLDDYEITDLREKELVVPISERVIEPIVAHLAKLGRRTQRGNYTNNLRRKMIQAGHTDPKAVERFLAVKVGSFVASPVLFLAGMALLPVDGIIRLAGSGLLGVVAILAPDAWLDRAVEDRQDEVRRVLPDIMDLLVISVEAGLSFDQGVGRVVENVPGPLSVEFARMLGELRGGASRADALRGVLDRIDTPEIRSFVLAITQADQLGTSMGQVLRSQAGELRIKRRQFAQIEAQKAPVKLLFPLVFCIFPTLLIVLAGPAMMRIVSGFGGGI